MSSDEVDDERRRSLLGTIRNLRARELDYQSQQQYLIKAAIMEGITWKAIGNAVGTTGQAAWERYHHMYPGKINT